MCAGLRVCTSLVFKTYNKEINNMRGILFIIGVLILTSVCFFDVSLLVLILGIVAAVSLLYTTIFCGWYNDNEGYSEVDFFE